MYESDSFCRKLIFRNKGNLLGVVFSIQHSSFILYSRICVICIYLYIYFRPQQQMVPTDESWDDEIEETVPVVYHKMSLLHNSIHLIDNPSKFEFFLDSGFQVIHQCNFTISHI